MSKHHHGQSQYISFIWRAIQFTILSAIVVSYLLALSCASVFISLSTYSRFRKSDAIFKFVAVVESYVLLVSCLAIFIKAPNFGTTPLCNENAVLVIFRPFNALHGGRIAAIVVLSAAIVLYTWMTYADYMYEEPSERTSQSHATNPQTEAGIDQNRKIVSWKNHLFASDKY